MTSHDAQAFWIVEPGRGEIRTQTLSPPGPDDVVVRALYSGISRGTEALVFNGRVPTSEHGTMRAPFQEGDFPGPVKYGYCNVGLVELGPPELRDRRVLVLYPHQTRYVVPAAAVHVLPDEVPASRGVLAPNLETAINGLWDAAVPVGGRIAVVGAGSVGCLTAWLAGRVPGAVVELVDVQAGRAAVADRLGVRFASPDTASKDVDVVVHCSGSAAGLDLALQLAGFEATIVEMSWYGHDAVPISLGGAFHSRRLRLVSSQVGTVSAAQRARWDTKRRMALAISLLAEPALDVLISSESDFATLPRVAARLANSPGAALLHVIRYP